MCGRYFIEDSPEMRPLAEAMSLSPLMALFGQRAAVLSHGEIRPTDVAPVIASNRNGRRAVFPMKWGFSGKSLLINAKAETAAEKPTFREAWASHRCIIPASYYFEWKHRAAKDGKKKTGDKFMLRPRGARTAWLCGLYRMENGVPCYVILTRAPSEDVKWIHDRMPLMLPEKYAEQWIRPDADPEALLRKAQTEIEFERADDAAAQDG